ncbi:hypothetical protein OC861_005114 [Tilletia horrida]|nr:hypothetical protein OC861_005114 [Tilletia horrida]
MVASWSPPEDMLSMSPNGPGESASSGPSRLNMQMVIPFVTLAIPLWEHLVGFPLELRAWNCMYRRKRRSGPRLCLPTAVFILSLRYATLVFCIVWAMAYFGTHWSTRNCQALWPVSATITTLLCCLTSLAMSIRIAALIPAAVQKSSTVYLLRATLGIFLVVQTVAFVVGWTMTEGLAFTAFQGRCTATLQGKQDSTPQPLTILIVFHERALLLLDFGCVLLQNCLITVCICWLLYRIRQQGTSTTSLVVMIVGNSIQYFVATSICAAFCMAWFVRKDPSITLLNLYVCLSAVFAIRMLSSEFTYGDRRTSYHNSEFTVRTGGPYAAKARFEHTTQPTGVQQKRYGGGLTDIEAVSVYPHGRSVERPEPVWRDEGVSSRVLESVRSLHLPSVSMSKQWKES